MAELEVEDLSRLQSVLPHVQASTPGNVIVLCNGKGGVGKSSLSANTAESFAFLGQKVLLVEMDPQANTAEDLGFTADTSFNDRGKRQADAVLHSEPLEPSGQARPRLYVAPGGEYLDDIEEELYCQRRLSRKSGDMTWHFMYAASVKAVAKRYDWVLLDVAPGSAVLQAQAMVAADYVVVPTRSDSSSRKGLVTVAQRIGEARPLNPDLRFLGVALFATGSGSAAATGAGGRRRTRIQDNLREALKRDLRGAAPIFNASIRHQERAAQACRTHGKTARELAMSDSVPGVGRHGSPTPSPEVIASAGHLAKDYRNLSEEILLRIADIKRSA